MLKTIKKRLHALTFTMLPLLSLTAQGQEISFDDYLLQLKRDAQAQGISQQTLDATIPQIKRFRKANATKDTETSQTLETYLPQVIPDWKVDTARVLFKENEPLLNRIADKYQVQPRFIVALWGLVSNFGESSGNYPVLSVTASQAYKGENEALYRKEFIAAMTILDKQQLKFDDLKSNGDGAMGQTQLSPSDFIAYAQDGDGDGRIDIWHSTADAFASAANLLKQQGWNGEDTWGRQVQVPAKIDITLVGLDKPQSLAKWQKLGVRRFDNTDLPNRDDIKASLIMPDGVKGRKYLVYSNYRALMHWQASDYFGISLVHFSERIKNNS
ncbi:lytic murein transglycosylase [Shewanella sp. A25]|nr:lytic murein transglycosylase [Shewanella shenzhenensis]